MSDLLDTMALVCVLLVCLTAGVSYVAPLFLALLGLGLRQAARRCGRD